MGYDKLVIAVGCYSQDFGIPGVCLDITSMTSLHHPGYGLYPQVAEHAHFLKDVNDSRAIRMRLLYVP